MKRHLKNSLWRRVSFCLLFFCLWLPGSLVQAEQQVYRVGAVPTEGFLTLSADGDYRGYCYEYMQNLAACAGVKFEYVLGSWGECLDRLQKGEIDIVAGKNQGQYPENYLYSKLAMGIAYTDLILSDDFDRDSRRPARIGYLDNEYLSTSLFREAAKNDLQLVTVPQPSYTGMMESYAVGQIDGYLIDMVYNATGSVEAAFDAQPYYFITRSDRKELMERLNEAQDKLFLTDPLFTQRLYEKYYYHLNSSKKLILTQKEKDYLQQKKTLKAVVSPGQKPYTYFENGEYKGIIAQLMKMLADDLGINLEIIETRSNAESYALIKEGKADVVLDFYSDFNWAERNNVTLTIPYLRLDYVEVVRRGSSEEKNPRVACVRSHFYTKAYVEKLHPKERCVYFDTVDECLAAVSHGQADVTYIKAVAAQYEIWQGKYHNLMTSGNVVFSHDVSIAVNNIENPLLVDILNKTLRHIDRGSIQQIVSKEYFATQQKSDLLSLFYAFPLYFLGGIVLIGLIVIAALIYLMQIRQEHLKQVHKMAYSDYDTGLPNVRAFEHALAGSVKKYGKELAAGRLGIVVFWVSRVDLLAEYYGRQFLAGQFKMRVRQMNQDCPWVKMYGVRAEKGQCFCLCVEPEGKKLEDLVMEVIESYSMLNSERAHIHIDTRVGLRRIAPNDKIGAHLLYYAETACNELFGTAAHVQVYDQEMDERLSHHQWVENNMRDALAHDEFKVWYQPKYRISSRECSGAEALIRWHSMEKGFLTPNRFIDIFERNGFIMEVDFYVLESVFKLQKRRLAKGLPVVPISVNQSRLHMMEESYLQRLQALVDKYALPPGLIELELTETAFVDMENIDSSRHAIGIVEKMKEMGFVILMDDFGSGYSSLTLLNYLPMDVMKIDRSLLVSAIKSKRSEQILANCVSLGLQLKMQVICEGIETEEQENLLVKYGCEYGQGYIYSKPLPEDKFEEFLLQH